VKRPAIEGGNPVRERFLLFSQPKISEDEIEEVVSVLRSGWLTMGPKTERFEDEFRRYIGTRHALSLNSCTAGLHLSLKVCGVKEGDEVITTPLTFCATGTTIVHAGARPVFADIKKDTLCIDPACIEQKITPRTKAIVPVHFGGCLCDMDEINAIANKRDLRIIHDCAHAIEAEYKDRKIGSFPDIASFSFYATKNLTTGEGGMVTTDNDDFAEKIKIMRLHGLSQDAWRRYDIRGSSHYDVSCAGFKYNMTDIQAALGIKQLEKIEQFLKTREKYFKRYDNAFRKMDEITLPEQKGNIRHARHLYVILLNIEMLRISRDRFIEALKAEGIGSSIHFVPLHLHSFYKGMGYNRGDFPVAEWAGDRVVSLPLSPFLKTSDIDDVIEAVKKLIMYYRR
jgi:dTDP-4-amino-4,6-dideoxygalactose transaminase